MDGSGSSIGVDFSINSLDFTATAWNRTSTAVDDRTQLYVYGDTNPEDSGLGAHTSGAQAGSGDNLWYRQSVKLAFDETVTLVEGDFFNGGHGTNFGSGVDLSILVNGTTWHYIDLDSPGGLNVALGLTGHTFEFWNNNAEPGSGSLAPYRVYVSTLNVSAVPEPTSMALFALRAGGLAIVRRRRKQSAA